jgi:hypothetical protein
MNYLLEGVYATPDDEGRYFWQIASLLDTTTSSSLFYGRQESRATPSESFTLGLEEGDYHNFVSGSLTGALVAGREYGLHYQNWIQDPFLLQPTNSASATGFLRLTVVVPEPGTGLLLLTGLLSLALRRRGV